MHSAGRGSIFLPALVQRYPQAGQHKIQEPPPLPHTHTRTALALKKDFTLEALFWSWKAEGLEVERGTGSRERSRHSHRTNKDVLSWVGRADRNRGNWIQVSRRIKTQQQFIFIRTNPFFPDLIFKSLHNSCLCLVGRPSWALSPLQHWIIHDSVCLTCVSKQGVQECWSFFVCRFFILM